MKKYRCIKGFLIDVVDGDGFLIEELANYIAKDSIWELDEDSFRVCGGEIRLIAFENDRYSWIELPEEWLTEYFEKIIE